MQARYLFIIFAIIFFSITVSGFTSLQGGGNAVSLNNSWLGDKWATANGGICFNNTEQGKCFLNSTVTFDKNITLGSRATTGIIYGKNTAGTARLDFHYIGTGSSIVRFGRGDGKYFQYTVQDNQVGFIGSSGLDLLFTADSADITFSAQDITLAPGKGLIIKPTNRTAILRGRLEAENASFNDGLIGLSDTQGIQTSNENFRFLYTLSTTPLDSQGNTYHFVGGSKNKAIPGVLESWPVNATLNLVLGNGSAEPTFNSISSFNITDGSFGFSLRTLHDFWFNRRLADVDFAIGGDTQKFLFFSDASEDKVMFDGNRSTFKDGNLTVKNNITSSNVFVPRFLYIHANQTLLVNGASEWTNVTFPIDFVGDPDDDIKFGINHTRIGVSNHTIYIQEEGVYNIEFDYDVEDTSAGSTDIDVAGRVIYRNGTEIKGSIFETDIDRRLIETELSHTFLARLKANDAIIFQFIANNVAVQISTHATFGEHPSSASIVIEKVANWVVV